MKGRTLILLALAAAVVGGLIRLDRARPSTDQARQAERRLFDHFERDDLRRIEILRSDGAIVLEQDEKSEREQRWTSGWWLIDPRRRAEQAEVEALLSALEFAPVDRHLPSSNTEERKRFGLSAPRVTLVLAGKRLLFGADEAEGRGVYVACQDKAADVLVIPHSVFEKLDRPRAKWISNKIIFDPIDAAQKIEVGSLEFEKSAFGFVLISPRGLADAAAVATLDKALTDEPGTLTDEPIPPGQPEQKIRVDERTVATFVVDDAHVLLSRSDGAHLRFARDRLPFSLPPERWLSTQPFPMSPFEVQALDLEGAFSLAREAQQWKILTPRAPHAENGGLAEDKAVSAAISNLVSARAISVATSDRGFSSAGALTLKSAEGTMAVEFDHARTRVRRRGEQVVLTLARPLFDSLSLASLRSLQVSSFSPQSIDRVEMTRAGSTRRFSQSASDFPLDLVKTLSNLHAAKFVEQKPSAPDETIALFATGQNAPAFSLTLQSCIGSLGERSFELSQETCEKVRR